MLRSLLRNLTLSSLFTVVMNSCSVSLYTGYHSSGEYTENLPVSWFKADTGYYLFNTDIDIMKNHFSGLTVIKPSGNDTCRVVFITEVGLKIFDMELYPSGNYTFHYIMSAVNKKPLVKMLAEDMGTITMNGMSGIQPELVHMNNSDDNIYLYRYNGKKRYYHVKKTAVHPYLVNRTSGTSKKADAAFYSETATSVDSIKITHHGLKMSMNLYRINESISHVAE
jgi:hypothetical protein